MNELLTKEEKRQQQELAPSRETERFFDKTLTAPPLLNEQTPPPLTDAAVVQNMRRDLTEQADVQVQIEDTRSKDMPAIADTLKSYKKAAVFGGNSPEYEAIEAHLASVIQLHSIPFTADKRENAKLALLAINGYERLVDACDAYVGKQAGAFFKGRFSSTGRHRQDLAKIIRDLAARDLEYLKKNELRIAETDGLSWGDVLAPARIKKVTISKSFQSLDTIGGNSTNNYILPGEKTVYFKKGESAIRSHTSTIGGEVDLSDKALLDLRRKIALDAGVDPQLAEVLIKNSAADYRPGCGLTPQEWAQHADILKKLEALYSKQTEINNQFTTMGINPGETIQLSKRNVASTRVADLLGLDCPARSRTMRVTDSRGASMEGNGMDAAPGIIMTDLKKSFGSDHTGSCDPQVIRQLSDLQMFDAVVSQIDRNSGNILVDQDKTGKVTRITGIDNDFSFPHLSTLRPLEQPQCPTFGLQASDAGRSINIPHISLPVAQRIMQLSEETLRITLVDVLEEDALSATCQRVKLIQDIIGPRLQQELEHPPVSKSERIFLTEDEWDDGVAQDFDKEKELAPLSGAKQASYARALLRTLRGDSGQMKLVHQTVAEIKKATLAKEKNAAALKKEFNTLVEWRKLGRADPIPNGWKPGMPTPPAPEA